MGLTGNSLFFSEGMELFGAMDFLQIILQVFVGLGILNVWLIRANWSTGYRGGDAKNLKEEFATMAYRLGFFIWWARSKLPSRSL